MRWSQTMRVMWKKRVMMTKLRSPATKEAMTRILTQVEREDNLMILKKKKTRPGKISMAEREPRTEPSFQINQRLMERILVVLVVGENTCLLQSEKLWKPSKVRVKRRRSCCRGWPS